MRECRKMHQNLVAFIYGELEEKEREGFESHLKSCFSCQKEMEKIKEVLKAADPLHRDIEEAMSAVNWKELAAQVTEKVYRAEEKKKRETLLQQLIRPISRTQLRPVYAGLAVGLILGSLFTFIILRSSLTEARRARLYMPEDYIERVELEMARRETLDYLEESQFLIIDVLQALSEKEPGQLEEGLTAQRARNLLLKKKYINHKLDSFQMAKAKQICDQIELLFYDLAQISDQLPTWRRKEILNLIEKKQLLLKIKILRKELENSEKSEV